MMAKVILVIVVLVLLFLLGGLIFPYLFHSQQNSQRENCKNHYRILGTIGLQSPSIPNGPMPATVVDYLPAGTFDRTQVPVADRCSWYVWTLNVVDQGPSNPELKIGHRSPKGLAEILPMFAADAAWNEGDNSRISHYFLKIARCPAVYSPVGENTPQLANYVANGGIGNGTPAEPLVKQSANAGAFRYDGNTPFSLIVDGLSNTIALLETNSEIPPWLKGGSATLRTLEKNENEPLGEGKSFGGCHEGGIMVCFADGSARFIGGTIDPQVFRTHLTISDEMTPVE
ncbi:MAG: DUF1559 domain-containing protein [Zavarzinella sp.]